MKILITGANGQLGRFLSRELLKKGYDVISKTSKDLDLLDFKLVKEEVSKVEVVVNCAAFTNVVEAETNPLNDKVNLLAVENLAKVTKGKLLIHISTNYVYTPTKNPYYNVEAESVGSNPGTAYGNAKAKADEFIINTSDDHLILRPVWLHSMGNKNFITKINLSKSETKKIVTDDIAQFTTGSMILRAVNRALEDKDFRGVFNISTKKKISRYNLYKIYSKIVKSPVKVIKCKTTDFGLDISNVRYSLMNVNKISKYIKVYNLRKELNIWIKEEEWKQ